MEPTSKLTIFKQDASRTCENINQKHILPQIFGNIVTSLKHFKKKHDIFPMLYEKIIYVHRKKKKEGKYF